MALGAHPAIGGAPTPCSELEKACNSALEASKEVIKEQDEAIIRLKEQTKVLGEKLAESADRERVAPTWLLVGSSILLGLVIGQVIKR